MKKIIQSGDAVRVVARRDSATRLLKDMGIAPTHYNAFIAKTTDGRISVNVVKAKEFIDSHLRDVKMNVGQARNKGKTPNDVASNRVRVPKAKAPKAKKVKKERQARVLKAGEKPSVSSVIKTMILAGKDNATIHAAMVRDYGHDDDKKHYPSWYRSQMRRDGLVPRDPATKKRASKKAVKKAAKKRVRPAMKKARERQAAKAKKASVKKNTAPPRTESRAQRNIAATKAASIKTGDRYPPNVGPLAIIVGNGSPTQH